MRRSHSSSQSMAAATAAAAQVRPKSQPPIKLGEHTKLQSIKSLSLLQQIKEEEKDQNWSKLIEKYDNTTMSHGRYVTLSCISRPMLETLVEHSPGDTGDATFPAVGQHKGLQIDESDDDDQDDEENEPELSPLISSASSGSSLASSTLSLSSVSSASTVIGANKMPMKRVKQSTMMTGNLVVSDEDDQQSSESSSCSSGISSLSERKASLCSTTSTIASITGSGERQPELVAEVVSECLENLISSVVDCEKNKDDNNDTDWTRLQALMVKRIQLENGYNYNEHTNQIISLARRHIFNALKHAQEIGERESSWSVCVTSKWTVSDKKPIIRWHQEGGQQVVFEMAKCEIVDCLMEHELVIWLVQSEDQISNGSKLNFYSLSKNSRDKDNWSSTIINDDDDDDERRQSAASTEDGGNLIGVHSETVDCDTNRERAAAAAKEAIVWLCSSESDARLVRDCWLSQNRGTRNGRDPLEFAPVHSQHGSRGQAANVCQALDSVDCDESEPCGESANNSDATSQRASQSEGGADCAIVIGERQQHQQRLRQQVDLQRTPPRECDKNERSSATHRRTSSSSSSSSSSGLRKAASVFDLLTAASSGDRQRTGSKTNTTTISTTGLASSQLDGHTGTPIRNLNDVMVRRVSSVSIVQQEQQRVAAGGQYGSGLRAAISVCDLSEERKLPQVSDAKLIAMATTGDAGGTGPASAMQSGNVTQATSAPLTKMATVTAPIVKPRTSILKARRDTTNADAQSKSSAKQQQQQQQQQQHQVSAATTSVGKCYLRQQQQQVHKQDINRTGGSRSMVSLTSSSSSSLDCLHQLQQQGDAGVRPQPRSILKAQVETVASSDQLNDSSKCSSATPSNKSPSCAQVVVLSSATGGLSKRVLQQQQHPGGRDSNEISRKVASSSQERRAELPVCVKNPREGAEGAKESASRQQQRNAVRSQTLASSSASSAASKRKLVHSLANCEIVARGSASHRHTHTDTHTSQQRARELSLSTNDITEQRDLTSVNSECVKGELNVVGRIAAKRDAGSSTTSKRDGEPTTKTKANARVNDLDTSSSLAREQAFERLRMRASCYDITRLMSKNNTIQSQLAKLRAGSGGGGGDLRQRKPAELRVTSSEQLVGSGERDIKVNKRDTAASLTANKTKEPTPVAHLKRSKRMSMFEQSGGSTGVLISERDTSQSAVSIKRAESVRCKKPVGGVPVLRHQELAHEQAEHVAAKVPKVNVNEVIECLVAEEEEEAAREENKQRVSTVVELKSDQQDESDPDEKEKEKEKEKEQQELKTRERDEDEDSEATIVEEDDDEEEEQVETSGKTKISTISKATAGGLSKFNLLRQSFNQKTISSMLKFSSRASLRIGGAPGGKRAPVPGPEIPSTASSGRSNCKDGMKPIKENALALMSGNQKQHVTVATKLPKATKFSTKHLVDLQQQQQIAAIDSATMMLYNRHMQQRQQQQQQQQQQLLQQQQQYAYQWHQQHIYIQHHQQQRQQLAYMANQYMTTAGPHAHLYQPHTLAPIAPQAAIGDFAAASSATTSMYAAMSARHQQQQQQQQQQQPPPLALMIPAQMNQHHQPLLSANTGVGSMLKKSILKSSSSSRKHNLAQMAYSSAHGRIPSTTAGQHPSTSHQQYIPLSVNHHSSVNIVYGAPRLNNSGATDQQEYIIQQHEDEEPPVTKIKQPSRANLLGASMRKTVKSILINSSRSSLSSGQKQDVLVAEKQSLAPKPLKSALKTSKTRIVPGSIQLNSEGSDGDQSTSSTLESSTSSNSSLDRDGDQQASYQPKSVLKKKSSQPSGSGPNIQDESHELSSTEESSSSSDNNFKRATSTRCSRRITKSPPKQYESGPSRASIRAPRKNVTFSTKLTSIL